MNCSGQEGVAFDIVYDSESPVRKGPVTSLKARRYGISLAVACCLLFLANWADYVRFKKLIPGYDYIIGYGVPFKFYFEGGSLDLAREIVWQAFIGNIIAVLVLAYIIAWIWRIIVRNT
jgi:hypothetical protein